MESGWAHVENSETADDNVQHTARAIPRGHRLSECFTVCLLCIEVNKSCCEGKPFAGPDGRTVSTWNVDRSICSISGNVGHVCYTGCCITAYRRYAAYVYALQGTLTFKESLTSVCALHIVFELYNVCIDCDGIGPAMMQLSETRDENAVRMRTRLCIRDTCVCQIRIYLD